MIKDYLLDNLSFQENKLQLFLLGGSYLFKVRLVKFMDTKLNKMMKSFSGIKINMKNLFGRSNKIEDIILSRR